MASSSLSQPTAPPSSPSKRQKLSLQEEAVVEKDGVDRISDLPDFLICHILSFLPTEEAVATNILSSRWTTLWTFVPCLYLNDNLEMRLPSSLHEWWNHSVTFPQIVSRIFLQHKAPYLRKFRIVAVSCCDGFHIDTWVRAAISPELEELDLFINQIMFELPRTIFNCKNLVVLKLSGRILLNLPSSFMLPSLKILHLGSKPYDGDTDSNSRLFSGCPVLEDLVIERVEVYEEEEEVIFDICVPTLKRLTFYFRNLIPVENPSYLLKINAPALEYFNFISDRRERELSFPAKLPNLVEANFDILGCYYSCAERFYSADTIYHTDTILGILRQLYNVKFLSLSLDTTECLSLASKYELPMFHNLTQLNYEVNCCNGDVLTYLLEQAPNLQVIVLERFPSPSSAHNHQSYCPPLYVNQRFPSPSSGHNHQSYCPKEPLYVGDLSPHLTTFYFRGFKGLKDELKFVRGILKKARILKKMTFRYGGNNQNVVEEKSRILKKVSNFPSCYVSCQIAFE